MNGTRFDDFLKEQLKDAEFRKEFEALKAERDMIRAKIANERRYGISYTKDSPKSVSEDPASFNK